MKRHIISVLCIILALPIFPQDSLLIHKKDGSIISLVLAEVDSIKFKRNPIVNVNSISLNRTAIGLLQGDNYTLQPTLEYEGIVSPLVTWS